MANVSEKIASSVLVSLVGGFLLAVALNASIDSAVIIWSLTVICSGLVIGGSEESRFSVAVKRAGIPAFILSITPVLFFYFTAVKAFIENPKALSVSIPWGPTAYVDPLAPLVILGVSILWVGCFIGSLLLVGASTVASRMVITGARHLYSFGPDGLERIKLIVLAVAATLAAVLAIAPALGK